MNASDHAATLPTRTGQYVRSGLALTHDFEVLRAIDTAAHLPDLRPSLPARLFARLTRKADR